MICIVTYVIGCLFVLYICCSSVDRANHMPISSNCQCYYWSSHTFLITDLFAAYHTHLVQLNCFCCVGSLQIVHPTEMYALHPTHLDLADHFYCVA